MTESDEGKKGAVTQHWFCTYAFDIAEIGFTFPDGSQKEYLMNVNRVWMGDIISHSNPALYNAPWLVGVTYDYGDIVLASDTFFYQSLEDGNLNLNPSGSAYPAQWHKISSPTVSMDLVLHPGPSESTFTQAADSTITTFDGIGETSANRGMSYGVSINQDLYGIGNSIPQNVSCECVTTHLDGSPITDGDVLTDICRFCGIPAAFLNFSNLTNACTGFAQTNQQSGKQLLTNFCLAKGYDLREIDGFLTALPRGSAPVLTIPDSDMGATLDAVKVEDRLPADVLADPRGLHSQWILHYRSTGQFFRNISIGSPTRPDALSDNAFSFDSGMSLDDAEAAQMVQRLSDIEWLEAGGKFGPLKLSQEYAYLAPGCVVIANDNGIPTRFRITEEDAVPGLFTFALVRDEVEVLNQSGNGDSGVEPILPNQLSVAAFAIASPAVDATDALAQFPGFYCWISTTPGYVPATIYYSYDNVNWNTGPTVVVRQNFGVTQTTALADATAPGYESTSLTDVKFVIGNSGLMHVDSYPEAIVQDGIQWALIGSEWVGIVHVGVPSAGVQQIGPGLIRGLRGSSYTGHTVGEQFAMGNIPSNINSGNVCKVQVDPSKIGQTVYVQVLTRGQVIGDNITKTVVIAAPTTMTPITPSSVSAGAPSYSGANEVVTFSVNLPSVPPSGQAYNWQYSTDGGTTWSASAVGGTSFTPPAFAAGTMMVQAQAVLTTGQTSAFVASADITYSATPTNFSEVPAGAVDGVNTTFTLSHTPRAGTLNFYINGSIQVPGTNYTLAGAVITTAVAPASASTVYATYTY
jgi:hypothetical protein